MEGPKVFKYHDHRQFLNDWIHFQRQDPSFSLRQFAKRCSLAVSHLSMILSGKRNLTESSLAHLAREMRLDSSESSFLKNLFLLDQASSHEQRLSLLKKIQKFKQYETNRQEEVEAYKYLTKWHYVALREMIQLDHFSNDRKWIQQKLAFPLTLKEVDDGLSFLEKAGFIQRTKSGYSVKEKILSCFDGIFKISLGEFYKQMFGLAIKAIDVVPREERLLLGHTFAVSNQSYEKVSAVLNEALEKVRQIEEQDKNKDNVYQVFFAALPLTKRGLD